MRFFGLAFIERIKSWVMGTRESDTLSIVLYDRTLVWLTLGLAVIGFVMVTSASMPVGQRLASDPFLFAKRDAIYLGLAFGLSLITLRVPMEIWQRYSPVLLLLSMVMLLVVLAVGSSVNGASRWISLGHCVFSLRNYPSWRCFATCPVTWCAKLKKCGITSGAFANQWA